MQYKNYAQIKAIENKNKQRWLKLDNTLTDYSGIYVLTRTDENGVKYSYVGQAKHILSRLAQHLVGYQHIDLSLKKHGLWAEDNIYGWDIHETHYCIERALDIQEQVYIKKYIDLGYQSRNKTLGGQGKGKTSLDTDTDIKGYRKGVLYGEKKTKEYVKEIFTKYLTYSVKTTNKITTRKLIEFDNWLFGDKEDVERN